MALSTLKDAEIPVLPVAPFMAAASSVKSAPRPFVSPNQHLQQSMTASCILSIKIK